MSDFDNRLKEGVSRLPKEIEPERDLWSGIDIALNNRQSITHINKRSAPAVVWNLAAGVALVAFIAWFGFQHTSEPSLSSQQLVALLDEQHNEHKAALLVSYKNVTPLTDNWQDQLTELDEAAAAIKMALEADPGNRALLKMLQQVYQQQISLIENVYEPKWQQI